MAISNESTCCWGALEIMLERVHFGRTDLRVSRVVLGTWVTGGWAWGGSDENDALGAILRSFELGINFVDTAPVYGFGKAETIVGRAVRQWGREDLVIATKCGLQWDQQQRIRRNSSPSRIMGEVDDSLKRLGIERIDLYQIHWPDQEVPFEDSIQVMLKLQEQGKIRWFGLSNFNPAQMEECLNAGPVYSLQPPFNLLEREIAKDILPFCLAQRIPTLVYQGLCRGLLTGKFNGSEQFPKGDLRRHDPKFKPDRFQKYVGVVDRLKPIAAEYEKTPAQFALRWVLEQPGVTCVIAGARTPEQAHDNAGAADWEIRSGDLKKVDQILADSDLD